MNYAKLEPLTIGLPSSAKLIDGRWVSNYNRLPDTVLKAEGWLPLAEIKPVLGENQYHELDSVAEVDGRIVATYKVMDYPEEIDPESVIAELEGLL